MDSNLVPRPASSAKPDDVAYIALPELPANVGQGNSMISTLIVRKECNVFNLAEKIRDTTFDCLVVMMTNAVTTGHEP